MAKLRRVSVAGLALGLGLGAAGMLPAKADPVVPAPVSPLGGLLGVVDGGVLGGLFGGLLHGPGGVFGADGGVIAGDDQLGAVVSGLTGANGGDSVLAGLAALSAIGGTLGSPPIGGDGSIGGPAVGGGLLGGLLGGAGGLLGGFM